MRIEYIDSLKGFAILMVVAGHLMSFSLGDNPLYTIIYTFHMPLFIWLSGYVVKDNMDARGLIRRICTLLIPFIIVGLSFTYFHGDDWNYFLHDEFKSGYWYLMVLAIFYLVHFLVTKICKRLRWRLCLSLLVFAAFGLIYMVISDQRGGVICVNHIFHLWPYFVIGHLCRRFEERNIFDVQRIWFPLSMIAVIAYCIAYNKFDFDHTSLVTPFILYLLISVFKRYHQVVARLNFVGKHTLDIYLFHYFVVSCIHLRMFGSWFVGTNNSFILLPLLLAASYAICMLCLMIGKILHTNYYLRMIVYGKLKQ